MATLVGVVLVVLAIIAFAQKHGALGIFAAGHWTELVWAVAGVVLLVLALLPRVGGGPSGRRPSRARGPRHPHATGSTTSGRPAVSGRPPVRNRRG